MDFTAYIYLGISVVALLMFFYFVPVFLWLSALISGVRISLLQLVLMRIRNVPPKNNSRLYDNSNESGISEHNKE